MNCIFMTHQFILDNEDWKLDIFDKVVKHYKEHNPETYLIITGHGKKPLSSTLDLVDWFYWSDDIVDGEIKVGHPKLVTKGLEHAKGVGVEYVCKTRLDSINMIPNITNYCHNILKENDKLMVNTNYMVDRYGLMDLFMFSKVEMQLKLFNPTNWSVSWISDGRGPLARNYVEDICNEKLKFPFNLNFWEEILYKNIIFLTPKQLEWKDLRTNKIWVH